MKKVLDAAHALLYSHVFGPQIRLMNAGLIVSDDPPEAARHSEQFVDPTLFLDGLHRVPTSFIGITLMVQLCQCVPRLAPATRSCMRYLCRVVVDGFVGCVDVQASECVWL